MSYLCFCILHNFLSLESLSEELKTSRPADCGPVSYLYIGPKTNIEYRYVNVDIRSTAIFGNFCLFLAFSTIYQVIPNRKNPTKK